jgi:hypothetical protein
VKEANNLLFWIIGLPLVAIVWIGMVGPETGLIPLLFMLVSLAIVLFVRKSFGPEARK